MTEEQLFQIQQTIEKIQIPFKIFCLKSQNVYSVRKIVAQRHFFPHITKSIFNNLNAI